MKHGKPHLIALALALPLLVLGLCEAASARIVCAKGFQKVGGSWLATPYCQDAYVAEVAREYGMRARAAEIRSNSNFKRYVCRFVGPDIRIKETCGEANAYGRRY